MGDDVLGAHRHWLGECGLCPRESPGPLIGESLPFIGRDERNRGAGAIVASMRPILARCPLLIVLPLCACPSASDSGSGPAGGSTAAEVDSASASTSHSGSSTTLSPTETSDPDSVDTGPSTTDEAPVSIQLEAEWLDALAGPWLGPVTDTPGGDIPQFFMEFAWESDGSLHTFVDDGAGATFDFTFAQEDDQWVFVESGTLPGGLTQTYTLHPVEQTGTRVRFEYLAAPNFLAVEIDLAQERFVMDVELMGNKHAAFDLGRPK